MSDAAASAVPGWVGADVSAVVGFAGAPPESAQPANRSGRVSRQTVGIRQIIVGSFGSEQHPNRRGACVIADGPEIIAIVCHTGWSGGVHEESTGHWRGDARWSVVRANWLLVTAAGGAFPKRGSRGFRSGDTDGRDSAPADSSAVRFCRCGTRVCWRDRSRLPQPPVAA